LFSGIVSHTSEIQDIKKNKDYWNLCIKSPNKFNSKLSKGASVSVNGVCLTYTGESKKYLTFDVINETLKITNLSKLRKGSVVNLERSLKFSSEIGGHLMSGHIQTTSQVIQIKRSHDTAMIKFSIGSKYKDYITEKGYVGINGCSLTISKKNKANFYVNLIPETLKMTNLSKLRVGSLVNLELDQNTVTIVDTVKNMLAKKS